MRTSAKSKEEGGFAAFREYIFEAINSPVFVTDPELSVKGKSEGTPQAAFRNVRLTAHQLPPTRRRARMTFDCNTLPSVRLVIT